MISQIRKNILTTTTLNIFTYLIPLVVTPYFVRVAGTENYGLLNIAQSIIQYLVLFVGFNLDMTVSGEIAVIREDREKLREIFWKTMYARLLLLLVATLVFVCILFVFSYNHKDTFLLTLTFIGLVGYALTPLWFYQGTETFLQLFLFVAIGKILFAVIVFTCITQSEDFWYYSLGLSLSQLLSGFLLLLYPIFKFGLKPITMRLNDVTGFIKEKFPLFTGGTVVNFCMNINVTLLGILLSLESFGLYMAANKLILVIFTLITLPLNQSLFPYISRSVTENFEHAVTKIQQLMVPGLTYLTIIICGGLFLFAKPIIMLMLGTKFFGAEVPFKLMVFSLIANVMTNVIVLQLFIKLGYLKAYAKVTQIASVIGVGITFSLASIFDLYGAAVAWLAIEFLLFIYSTLELRRAGIVLFISKAHHPKTILNYWVNNYKLIFLRR